MQVFLEGMVRGWTPILPACVMGQWQAMKLGVDRSRYGDPFWNTRFISKPWQDNTLNSTSETACEEPEPFWEGLKIPLNDMRRVIMAGKDVFSNPSE